MWDTLVRPSADRAEAFRAGGHWRTETVLDDLRRAVAAEPDKAAIIGYCGDSLDRIISYRELGVLVDRFAAALVELGVRRQDVVAIHLPEPVDGQPAVPGLRPDRCGAGPGDAGPRRPGTTARADQQRRQGVPGPGQLRRGELPGPARRCRSGHPGPPGGGANRTVRAGADGLVDFAEFFLDTPWEQTHQLPPLSELRADDVSLLLFTSGHHRRAQGGRAQPQHAVRRGDRDAQPVGLGCRHGSQHPAPDDPHVRHHLRLLHVGDPRRHLRRAGQHGHGPAAGHHRQARPDLHLCRPAARAEPGRRAARRTRATCPACAS